MINLKTTIYYISESEKKLIDILLKKQVNDSSSSTMVLQKSIDMVRSFSNMLMEDEMKIMITSNNIESVEKYDEGKSFFTHIMTEAERLLQHVNENLDDESSIEVLSNQIISIRLNYLALKSTRPDIFK